MSKGGSSSNRDTTPPVQQVETTNTNLPAYAEPYFRQGLERSVYESARPYEAFPGQRLADFTTQERAAMQGMEGMARAGSPSQFLDASNIARNIGYQGTGSALPSGPQIMSGQPNSGMGDLGTSIFPSPPPRSSGMGMDIANQFNPQSIESRFQTPDFGPGFTAGTVADTETIQRYTNPYQQMVTDIEKREAARQSDIMGSQIGQRAAQAGGMGGYREAIMQAERERNLGQQLGDIQTRGSQAGFQQAQQAFEADRDARFRAGQLGLQTGQAADTSFLAQDAARLGADRFNVEAQRQRSELGLRGLQGDQAGTSQRLDAARLLGGFGQQQQDMDYTRLKNLQASGEIQRQLDQQGMTMGYQDFLRQQAFPREQLGFFNNMLRGLPITPGSTTASYGGPSSAERLLGSGISSVGLYNALNR